MTKAQYIMAWRKANPTRAKAIAKKALAKYYRKNKKASKARTVEWVKNNPTRAKAIAKKARDKFYKKNKKAIIARGVEWMKNNPKRHAIWRASTKRYNAKKRLEKPSTIDIKLLQRQFDRNLRNQTQYLKRKIRLLEGLPPLKRGRQGDKIQRALKAVTSTPVAVDSFIKQYGVSLAVLRQSKRFLKKMDPAVAKKIGTIFVRFVRQDKATKQLRIWKVAK